jgi:hypothetical protein
MKKLWLVVLALLMVSVIGFSLDLSAGVKAGFNVSSYAGSDYRNYLEDWPADNAIHLGFQFGGFATIGLLDFLAIEPEVLVAFLGDTFKEDMKPYGYGGYARYYDKLTYLEPAVLAKIRFGSFNVFAGPMLMVRLGSGKTGTKADDDDLDDLIADEVDYEDDVFKKMVFAVTGGGGSMVPVGPGDLLVEVRGQYSLQNMLNEDEYRFHNYSIMMMLGYSYSFRK